MDEKLLARVARFGNKYRRMKRWQKIVSALACVVVFCTTYALILPAITMEKTSYCGYEEHVHTDECYEVKLLCETASTTSIEHTHTESCYTKESTLVCTLEETEGHTHSDACIHTEQVLSCNTEESEGHTHSDACYENTEHYVCGLEEDPEHVHDDSCIQVESNLVCGQEESAGHTHTSECYIINESYVCGQEESEGHTHSEDCYVEESVLNCNLEEEVIEEHVHTAECYETVLVCAKEEHEHSLACYSDSTADVESAANWENTLPKELSGVWADDVIAVAKSQLGYEESTRNYIVTDEGKTKGYSRYGAWYGDPYGHWCAMFASFCLHYADVDTSLIPLDCSCQNWIETLSKEKYDLYRTADTYIPVPGDLIFFDNDQTDNQVRSNHVGIVVELIAEDGENINQVKTIEGNASNMVKYCTYNLTDSHILGYGVLPENPEMVEANYGISVLSLDDELEVVDDETEEYPVPTNLTGRWDLDLVTVAESQVGYTESTTDFIVESWKQKGYTKYGDYYDDKYGDWTAMFVSYCLYKAGVYESSVTRYTDAQEWYSAVQSSDLYGGSRTTYTNPLPGDIVFLGDWGATEASHVGVVQKVEGDFLYVIVGDRNNNYVEVQSFQGYSSYNTQVLGYLEMPRGELTASTDGITATATFAVANSVFASGTELVVELLDKSDWDSQVEENILTWGYKVAENYYLAVYFEKDGERVEPKSGEKVDISIEFTTPLVTNITSDNLSGNFAKWIFRSINKNSSDELVFADVADNLTVTYDSSNNAITGISFVYEKAEAFSISSTQETYTELTFEDENITATAYYKTKMLPKGTELVVKVLDDSDIEDTWLPALNENLQTTAGYGITANHFVSVYFECDEERVEPEGDENVEIDIAFSEPLDSNASTYEKSGELSWVRRSLNTDSDEAVVVSTPNKAETMTTTDNYDLSNLTFAYENADTFSLSAMQNLYTTLETTVEIDGVQSKITAIGSASALSEDMKLVVEFLSDDKIEPTWIEKLEEEYLKEGLLMPMELFFTMEFQDKDGNPVSVGEEEIYVTISFSPAVSVVLENDRTSDSGEWKLSYLAISDTEEISVTEPSESNNVKIEVTDEIALSGVAFNYEEQELYSLIAVVEDPDYVKEIHVTTYDELYTAIAEASNGSIKIILDNDIDATGCISIPSDKNIEIDLNGHVIKTSTTLFSVDGGTLKIIDSQKKDESVAAGGSNVTGNSASYNSSSKTLTYYVTESVVTNSEVGYTQETLYVHTVELTGIIDGAGSTGPVIQLNSGVLNFDSGAIVDSQNRAIAQKGGTLNLTGGYICGNTASSRDVGNGTTTWDDRLAGGAIYTTGTSTINLSGTVLAANSVTERGGAIAIESWEGAVLNITGGVISGNVCTSSVDTGKNDREIHVGGGGIFTDGNVTVNMSGGYITNNISKATGYFDGGGGIFISGNSVYSLNGGYVTGNYAESGGGGIRSDFWGHYTKFYLNGGFVSSNHANLAEGGGVSINWDGVAYIFGGYVTNNSTSTTQHWGGGGLFVSNGAKMYVVHAVITENDAGGFGGGLAGCSTGRVFIVSNDGGAIYNNDAAGTTVTIGSEKAEDKIYGLYNPVFMACGFQDYFCALTSTVEGNMLGGGAANRVGSADEVPVSIGKGETLTSSYVMGLTSHPSTESINLALQAARATNGVYINNNTSHTHGGAILCNGYLVVGSTKSIEIGTSLELSAKKTLLNEKEEEVLLYETDTDGNISVKEFKFVITDEAGTVVSEGTNDKDGTITFTERLAFTKAGTFTYYIYEDVESNSEGYVMDTSQYKLLVTVAQESASFDNGITRDQYKITNIVVQKKNDGDWENFSTWNVEWKDEYEYSPVKMELTSGSTFTNYELNSGTTKVTVVKKWTGSTSENSVTVTLYQNGAAYTGEDASVVLNSGNNWTYTWDKLPVKDEDGNKYSYTVQETVPDGYSATYEIYNEVSSNSIWVPATAESLVVGTEYIIVSPDGNYALYLTPDHSDKHLTSADKVTVSKGKETVTVGGVEYTDYYAANTIAERNIYKVSTGTLNSGATGTLMLNKATGSGLLIEPVNGLNLKDGTAVSSGYVSSFYLSGGMLIGYEKWSLDTNQYVICYDESNEKFEAISVDDANATAQAAKLYVKVQGDSVLENETSVIITNTKASDITYGLNITKVSDQTVGGTTNIPLAGATFNLKDKDGIALRFTKTADGVYVWYSGTVTEEMESITTTELVTNTRGKLAISGLPAGTYTLEETKAPEGYELAEAEEVVLGQSGDTTIELKIVDEKKTEGEYNLPETGGTGTSGYTAGGVLLILLAACMLFLKQKNQKKGGYYSNGS